MSCTTRGFQCRSGCPRRGGLLLHHFTLTCALADHRRYPFCCTFRPGSSRFPSPIFMRRVALWCPDFPQTPLARDLRPSGERQKEPAPSSGAFQGKVRFPRLEPALANSDHQSEIKDLQSTIHFVPALAIGPSRPFVGLIEQRYSDINSTAFRWMKRSSPHPTLPPHQ